MEQLLVARDFPSLDGSGWLDVDGGQEAAQNIREALLIPLGSLPWDRSAGSEFPRFLNNTPPSDVIIAEIRRVAIGTPDVIASTVHVRYVAATGQFLLTFQSVSSTSAVAMEIASP